jgi:hypothetical protein
MLVVRSVILEKHTGARRPLRQEFQRWRGSVSETFLRRYVET